MTAGGKVVKALTYCKGKGAGKQKQKSVSRSARAGLQFPVGRSGSEEGQGLSPNYNRIQRRQEVCLVFATS